MTVDSNVTADGAVVVKDAHGVRAQPVDIDIDLVVDGATQAKNGTTSSSSSSSSFAASSVVRRTLTSDGGGAGCATATQPTTTPYITLVLNVFNRIYVDARRLVSGSTDVDVGPQTIQVGVRVANVTQLDEEAASALMTTMAAAAAAAAASSARAENNNNSTTNGLVACRRSLRRA